MCKLSEVLNVLPFFSNLLQSGENTHFCFSPLQSQKWHVKQDKSSILQVVVPNRHDIVSVIVHHDDDRDRQQGDTSCR